MRKLAIASFIAAVAAAVTDQPGLTILTAIIAISAAKPPIFEHIPHWAMPKIQSEVFDWARALQARQEARKWTKSIQKSA